MNRLFINLFTLLITAFIISCSGKTVSRQETIDNFEKREKEILALADYFESIKVVSNEVHFKSTGNRYTISIGQPDWAISPEHPIESGIEMKINSAKMDSLLKKLSWTVSTVQTLKKLLSQANCEYISSHGDYLKLGYRTGDICSFCYFITTIPFADSTIKKDTKLGITFLRNNVRIGSSCIL